ncbi:MAG: Fumarylacetoacetate hydrolase family protein, partial [uncultured Acetobacteraceae bacterium]
DNQARHLRRRQRPARRRPARRRARAGPRCGGHRHPCRADGRHALVDRGRAGGARRRARARRRAAARRGARRRRGAAARAHPPPPPQRLLRRPQLHGPRRGRRPHPRHRKIRTAEIPAILHQGPGVRDRAGGNDPRPRRRHPMARLRGGAGRSDRPGRPRHPGRPRAGPRLRLDGRQRRHRPRPPAPPRPVVQGQVAGPLLPARPVDRAGGGAGRARHRHPLPRERRNPPGEPHEQDDLRRARDHPPALDGLHPPAGRRGDHRHAGGRRLRHAAAANAQGRRCGGMRDRRHRHAAERGEGGPL